MMPNEILVGREKINFEAKVLRVWRCDNKPDSWQSIGTLHTVFNLYLLFDEQTQNRRCLIFSQTSSNDAKVTPISNHFVHPQTVLRKSSSLTVGFWVQDYVEQLLNSKEHYSDIVKFEPKLFCLRLKFANEETLDKFVAVYQTMQRDMASLHADTEVIWKADSEDIDAAAKARTATAQQSQQPTSASTSASAAPSSAPQITLSESNKSAPQATSESTTPKPLFGNPASVVAAVPSLFNAPPPPPPGQHQPVAATASSKPQVAEPKGSFMTVNAGSTPAPNGGLFAEAAPVSSNTAGAGSSLFGGFGGASGAGQTTRAVDSGASKPLFGGAPSSFGLSFAPSSTSNTTEASASKPLFGGGSFSNNGVGQSLFGGGGGGSSTAADVKSLFGPLGGAAINQSGDVTAAVQSAPSTATNVPPQQKEEQAQPSTSADSSKAEVKDKATTSTTTPGTAPLFGNGTTTESKTKESEESTSTITKETHPPPSASAPPPQRSSSESSAISPPSLLGASRSISESILRRDSETIENKPFFPITPAEPIFKNFPASPQLKPRSPSTPQFSSTSSPLVPPMSIGGSSVADDKENGTKGGSASKPTSSFFTPPNQGDRLDAATTSEAKPNGFNLSGLANALSPSAAEGKPPAFSPTTTTTIAATEAEGAASEISDFQRKLQSFYENNNPEKISEVPKLAEKYKNKQNEVWDKLKAKYPDAKEFVLTERQTPVAATPAMSSRTLSSLGGMTFEQQLRRFYEKYNPDKASEVPKLVEKYSDRQAEVWTRLKTKYPGASPEDIPAVQASTPAATTSTPAANPFSGFASALGTPLTQTETTSSGLQHSNNAPGFTPSSVNAFAASKLNVTPSSTTQSTPFGGGGATTSSWAIPSTQSIQFGAPKILQPGNLSARLNTPGAQQQQPASFGNFSSSSFGGQTPSTSGGFSSFASQASGTSAFANLASQSNGSNAFNQ